MNALQWLILNNTYYKNITVNFNAVSVLPQDDYLSDLSCVTLETTCNTKETPLLHQNPYDDHLVRTFVPLTTRRMTEQETVRQVVNQQY